MALARRATRKNEENTRKLAVGIAQLAHNRNAEDIIVLDLRGLSPITDYFVIGTGTSDRQMRSLADEIEDFGTEIAQKLWKAAGRDAGDWIVMDFVDVVVHLFNQSMRRYYDLELIWGEAPKVQWRPDGLIQNSSSESQ
ncbi:MAG TPA: ribosome silencing factor [Phycisphaerae bacterium]|nr:ribosome silencing factor [Phycisphaerae bacterium]